MPITKKDLKPGTLYVVTDSLDKYESSYSYPNGTVVTLHPKCSATGNIRYFCLPGHERDSIFDTGKERPVTLMDLKELDLKEPETMAVTTLITALVPPPKITRGETYRIIGNSSGHALAPGQEITIDESAEIVSGGTSVVITAGTYRWHVIDRDLSHVSKPTKKKMKKAPATPTVTEVPVTLGSTDILGQEENIRLIELAADLDHPVLIIGETGTGKTSVVKHVAQKRKKRYQRFNLTGETTVDEFVGKYVLAKDGETNVTAWEDGILIQAMKNGWWLIVDEINVALPEILFVLHSLLDDEKAVMVAGHNGEIVRPHNDFRFFGTMNPVDEYAGTKELNKAFKSRFGMILNMGYPEPAIEMEIVSRRCGIDTATAMKIVDTGVAIRKAKKDDELFYTCSTRDLIQWGQWATKMPLKQAFEVAVLNKADGDRDKVSEKFSKVTGLYLAAEADGTVINLDLFMEEKEAFKVEKEAFYKEKEDVEGGIRKRIVDEILVVSSKKAS